VLVVDDNVINLEVAQAMLERVGCRVTVAEDGNGALDHAHRRRFDAILMDCQMPGMDGYAATAAIRRTETERRSQATPIVALTANVLARDRTRCLEAGMNHFLAKPFSQDQLIAVLRPIAMERGTLVVPPPVVRPAPQPKSVRTASGLKPVRPEAEPPARSPVVVAAEDPVVEEEGPLLSDTIVLDMLEVPLGDGHELNSVPLLDPEQVAAIRGLGKPQVFERLCQLLFTTAPESLQRLAAALDAGDLDAIGATAHSLKSPVNSLGGRRLAEQLERCEMAARDQGDIKSARKAARGMKQTYADLEAALRAETARATGT
jgi:two-component system, sensor histidine kinase and response regulator